MIDGLALMVLPALSGLMAGADAADHCPAAQAVEYPSGKDPVPGLLYRPAEQGRRGAVIVVHGDMGLTEPAKALAARLAGQGFVVLAVDLYRGAIAADVMEAHILGRGVPDDRALADLKAAVDYLTARPDVRRESIGIVGWELGGGYALDAAMVDRRLRAVVVCCGSLPTDPARLARLHAPVLGLFTNKDEGTPPATILAFAAAMRKAGKRIASLHTYAGCSPDFLASPAAPGSPVHRAVADAQKRMSEFLRDELQTARGR